MYTNRIKVTTFLVATFLCNLFSYSQLSMPFKMRYQSFVKGDMTVIANNITNRVDYENTSNVPYYNHTSSAKLNDEYTMEYIDIDDDQSTFSSSSAELTFDNNSNKKILYAGLYWSATYKYNSGYQKKIGKFVADNPTRDSFNRVQVKFPNSENYTTIKGETIFDGVNQKEFKEFAPYAVYADITSYVKELSNASGVYTVADVKATQGMLSGGVAGGWTIFFVYEDQEMSGKFITSFDGFAGVTDKSTEILFNGFETLPQGSVKAKIACAALEGDNNMIGDQLLFNTTGNIKDFVALSNPLRKTGNFFNSSITIENKYFTNRFPDSKNTLGYDTCLITIPNPNNTVIGNNIKEATLKLKSSGDRYLMFFTAFNVEVTDPNATPIIVNDNPIVSVPKVVKSKKEVIKNTIIKEIPAGREMIADSQQGYSTKNLTQKKQALSEADKNNKKEEQIEIRTVTISNQESGYYIVANVFSNPENAEKFISLLKSKGIEAKYFVNKINKYRYVYLSKTSKELEAINLYLSKVNDTYQDKIWILSVNNINLNKAITNNDY
ncbi:SPOR domain-containing protein [Flavobacterium sp.]|uniref:SPOR domain-containing protein n=1 Tax=Flavobacterium sp. TaxID=239 RepID=UPI0037529C26